MSLAATVRDLFDELAPLSRDEQQERLDALDSLGDQARAELERLLEADAADSKLLSPTWMADLVAPLQSQLGQRVGAYELVELLGSGGMGDVFLAHRADGEFEQEAAIKLVRRDLASPRVLERFGQERQILARLNHPNIARLLDGGVTSDGRPYLVMEVVDGVPLDEHCRNTSLDLEHRLRLFLRACEAVEHAHGNLVVHCDLKPDNILITDSGELKLLDFGIATALSDAEQGTRAIAMTPSYAAPELFDGDGVTTAADVYSLGVILYQLLTGAPPVDLTGLSADERREKVQSLTIAAPNVSADLDAICLRALDRDPATRYPSPRSLAADIVAVLEHRPVSARARSFSYVAGKLARRHAAAVVAGTIAVALLIGVVIFYTARLTDERDRARAEASRAAAASRALVSVFSAADPDRAQGEPISAQLMLRRGRAQIASELVDQPRLLAEMLLVIARVSFNLGLYADAESALEETLAIERRFEDSSSRVGDALGLLGDTLREQARFDEAAPAISAMLAIRHRLDGLRSLPYARGLLQLSALRVDRGDFEGGLESATLALEIQRERGADDGTLADSLHAIGGAQAERGDMTLAEASYREAFDKSRAARGERHPSTVTALGDLAYSLRKQGRFDEAEPLYREALRLRELLFEGDHPDVAHNLNHLGRLLYQKKELDAALPFLERSLAMRRRLYGSSHAAVSASLGTTAQTLIAMDRLDEAEPLAREAFEILSTIYGESHPYVAESLGSLASVLALQGKRAEAVTLYRRAVAIGRKVHEGSNPRLGAIIVKLGAALCKGAEKKEGRALLDEADTIFAIKLPETDRRRVELAQTRERCR